MKPHGAKQTGLTEDKERLLALLLAKEGFKTSQMQRIQPRTIAGHPPLSFVQQRLWFLDQLGQGNAAYNIPLPLRLRGPLNLDALHQSLNEIVRRHEALRTTFGVVDEQPVQIIAPELELSLPLIDLSDRAVDEREAEAWRLVVEEARSHFDLSRGPLIRATMLRLGAEDHLLISNMHHTVSDGWSLAVFMRELSALYTAFSSGKSSPLPALPIQYADFALWQREWLQGSALDAQLTYWKHQLAGPLPLLELPTDRPRPAVRTFRGAIHSFVLPAPLTHALMELSQRKDVTPFMLLLTAFKTLLYRYTGQEDLLVGTPVANRTKAETEALIGFFVNTLVLRTKLTGQPTFGTLLQRVREVVLQAFAHQDLPFEKLVEALNPERSLSHMPLFQVAFAFQGVLPVPTFAHLTVQPLEVHMGTAQFDLTLFMEETDQGLTGRLEYNTDLFEPATIARMIGHFQTLLESAVANLDQPISRMPLLTTSERRQMLVEWNATQADYPRNQCFHTLFEAHAAQSPDAVAVVFKDRRLTYRELNRRANQLAHHLRTIGIGRHHGPQSPGEQRIGVCMERSPELVVGILGILKAGGVYVPLDPNYPSERLAFMLADAQTPVLLTQQRLVEKLPTHQAQVICLDDDWDMIAQQSEENPSSGATPDNLAYVIYTSGSTGNPKGVLVPHRGLCNVAAAQTRVFGTHPGDGVLQFTSPSFDASIFDISMAFGVGARLCLDTAQALLPGPSLVKLLREQEIAIVTLTPSALAAVPDDELPALRTISVAGEACPAELVERWAPGRRFFNLYGPTEATIWATMAACDDGSRKPPIGSPIANTQIYLLDQELQPVPIGVPGELHIGGVGVARGYLNRPALTAQKFIPDPFSAEPGTRLYRTGDLARYLPDGKIEFLGRIDHQIKLRGFRIELSEIEAVLHQHPGVREALVLAREDEPAQKRLVAYIIPATAQHDAQSDAGRSETQSTTSELRAFLKERLPDYMVPAAFVLLDAFPLTPNGKVDRQALLAPDMARPELAVAYAPPRTEIERVIAAVWQSVLQTDKVGVHDNFFDLGGHSLLLLQVHDKFQQHLQQDVSILEMFEYPTVSSLAQYLDQRTHGVAPVEADPERDEALHKGKNRLRQQQRRRTLEADLGDL